MIVSAMKSSLAVLTPVLCGAMLAAGNAELSQVQSVYLLPMGNGLEQYLANHLTNQGVYQVVTDPEQADAVLTDQIGPAFEKRFEDLYATPAGEEDKPKAEEKESGQQAGKKEEPVIQFSSFSRGKGNVFLVDRKSRRVLWSIHERPKDATPSQLDRAAERIVSRLKKALTGK